MNIETGVFTTVTSGYYIVTYSASVDVHAGEYTYMYLYQNGVQLKESESYTAMGYIENGDNHIYEQASKTVVRTPLDIFLSIVIFLALRFFTCWLVTHWISEPGASVMRFLR